MLTRWVISLDRVAGVEHVVFDVLIARGRPEGHVAFVFSMIDVTCEGDPWAAFRTFLVSDSGYCVFWMAVLKKTPSIFYWVVDLRCTLGKLSILLKNRRSKIDRIVNF